MIFAGQRPADEIPAFLDAADALVSPRSSGTNTPLKIYQYLRSGRPIVATRLLTHTQVLDDAVRICRRQLPQDSARPFSRRWRIPNAPGRSAPARGSWRRRNTATRYLTRTRQALALLAEGTPEVVGGVA